MKKLFFPVVLLVALFIIGGCSEKFKIAAPYKNITVVYGFLDQADTAHYIRIQKAFLDANKSALSMSQTPDSSFYANLDVKMELVSTTGTLAGTIHLNRVDLDLEGYPKQPGTFFNSPNYAYKFKDKLQPTFTYRLVITNLTTGEVDSADAPVFVDNQPGDSLIFAVDIFRYPYNTHALNFASTGSNEKDFSIQVQYDPTASTQAPSIADAVLRFNWWDSNIVTHALVPNHYDYDLGYQPFPSAPNFSPLNFDLYKAIFAGMGVAPANTLRLLDRCDAFVYLSTSDFATYQAATATQGLGLTGSEIEPIYTNIKGANTIGLFTGKAFKTGKITIFNTTVDSLIVSPYLSPAKIVGTIYH